MGCSPWGEAILIDPLGSWLSNGPGGGTPKDPHMGLQDQHSASSPKCWPTTCRKLSTDSAFSPFLLRSRHCRGTLRRAALGWGQGPLPAPGSCWFGPTRNPEAAAQAGGAKPAIPGASAQRGVRPQDGGVGGAAAWVGRARSQQPTQGVLSLGLHPPRSPLGRGVVGSPTPYDLPSQLLLRSTCQRSLVTDPSTLWRGLANGQRRAGWGRKATSPGLTWPWSPLTSSSSYHF